jgi:hypothetical protein
VCANEGPIVLDPPPSTCEGTACSEIEIPSGCAVTLGAGKQEAPIGTPCGVAGDLRYLTHAQPQLVETFECIALVGAGGDGNERPMEAMLEALGSQTSAGGCHEGFVRDDAILVVTFITDEDDEGSIGSVTDWVAGVLEAKQGRQDAIVVLGLLGDADVPGGLCTTEEAQDAPRLREFAESFERGSWASVCAPSYDAFFEAAISVIDATCDEFVPVG